MQKMLALGLIALASARPVAAQSGIWQPDDRILITSFFNARDVATDQQHVFVATTNGLEIYDQTFQRWLPPSTIEDGYPAQEVPARIAYDARERGIWLVTELQTVYTWSPVMQNWQQRFITDIPNDVRAQLSSSLNDRDPAWQVLRNSVGRDAQGRNWRATGRVPGERPGTFWVSTYGGNFTYVDTRNLSTQPFHFGTIARGVSALALHDGQLYFGSDGRGQRQGVTRADTELQRWEQFEPRVAEGPRRRIHALLPTELGVYVASDDGLFVLRRGTWQRIADGETRALAQFGGNVWAGTRGALGRIDATDNFLRTELPAQNVNVLAVRSDTLWIGTSLGLYRVVSAEPELVVSTSQPVLDLAWSGDTLIALTNAGVHTFDGGRLSTPLRHTSLERIGRPVSLSAIGDRVYIGGQQGVAEWQPASGAWRHLTVPADVPEGPVYDVLEENGRLWLATPAGALRLEW